ncbi:serine/threonine protein kinase [Vibrio sp. JCM 18905]|nr:serine/threonine protein kinase [Vibrio sp. JCM 18905]
MLSIARQINSQLEKSRYSKEEDSKSIYELKDELNQIHQDYPFTPSSLSSDVFGKHLTEALKNKDAAALVALIKVGNTFFSNVEEHQNNLKISNAMKDAVLEMKLYETALDSNDPLPFPDEAARILFQEEFENFYYRLEKARTTTHLDNLVKDVDQFSKNFPIGFQDINDLRFKTADKYLRFSDILLNKRRTTSARRAMKKANELMRQVEQDSKQS